jgi:MraZ protein
MTMATTTKSDGPIRYVGQHLRGVDKSRRVMLPPEWRPKGTSGEFSIHLWPLDTREYLLILPPARWAKMVENIGEASLTDRKAAVLQRLVGANSYTKSLDAYGRLPLPDPAARVAGLENEALLVGSGDKFEIWNPAKFAASLDQPETKRVLENLENYKL